MYTKEHLIDFLKSVDEDFPIHLSMKVEFNDYAKKLLEKATLCSIYDDNKIEALIAGYTQNIESNIAYISLVAVRAEARGNGYARSLILQFLDICRKKNIKGVHLYAHVSNTVAIHMYEKIGFEKYVIINEPRPSDIHLIYWIKR